MNPQFLLWMTDNVDDDPSLYIEKALERYFQKFSSPPSELIVPEKYAMRYQEASKKFQLEIVTNRNLGPRYFGVM